MAEARFDDSRWPTLLVTFPPRMNHEEAVDCLATLHEYRTRKQRWVAIIDWTELKLLPPVQRKMTAEWMKAGREYSARWLVAGIFVCKSAITRGFMTAVYWLYRAPYKLKVVASCAEAFHLAEVLLAQDERSSTLPGP